MQPESVSVTSVFCIFISLMFLLFPLSFLAKLLVINGIDLGCLTGISGNLKGFRLQFLSVHFAGHVLLFGSRETIGKPGTYHLSEDGCVRNVARFHSVKLGSEHGRSQSGARVDSGINLFLNYVRSTHKGCKFG